MKSPKVDPLEKEVARATKALQEIEAERDAIEAPLAAARAEHDTARKAVEVEMQAAGAAKARAWQRGTPAPSLDELEAAERAERVTAQGVAVLESARVELQRTWTDVRRSVLRASMDIRRAQVDRCQADFTAVVAERAAQNRALDQREHQISNQQRQAAAELAQLGRELDDLMRKV